MSASGPPLCRICQKEHWMRDPHILLANAKEEVRAKRAMIENNVKMSSAIKTGNPTITLPAPANRSTTNTRREGRDVLKGAKPTSTASTERPNPPKPPAKAGTQTKAAKVTPRRLRSRVTPGKRKTATKANKRKGTK